MMSGSVSDFSLSVFQFSERADQFEFIARGGRTPGLFSAGASRHARKSNYRVTHGIRDRETEPRRRQQRLGNQFSFSRAASVVSLSVVFCQFLFRHDPNSSAKGSFNAGPAEAPPERLLSFDHSRLGES
jgi:hypothetical protein